MRGKGVFNYAVYIKVYRTARGKIIEEFADVFGQSEITQGLS